MTLSKVAIFLLTHPRHDDTHSNIPIFLRPSHITKKLSNILISLLAHLIMTLSNIPIFLLVHLTMTHPPRDELGRYRCLDSCRCFGKY